MCQNATAVLLLWRDDLQSLLPSRCSPAGHDWVFSRVAAQPGSQTPQRCSRRRRVYTGLKNAPTHAIARRFFIRVWAQRRQKTRNHEAEAQTFTLNSTPWNLTPSFEL